MLFYKRLAFATVLVGLSRIIQPGYGLPILTWMSPNQGDIYYADGTITMKWQTDEAMLLPVILLCRSSIGELSHDQQQCAVEKFPSNEIGAGVHAFDITVPQVLSQEAFVLIIADEGQGQWISPPFFIAPAPLPDISPTITPNALQSAAQSASATTSNTPTPTNSIEAILGVAHGGEKPIALGVSFSIIGLFLLCLLYGAFRVYRSRRKTKEADKESSISTHPGPQSWSRRRGRSASSFDRDSKGDYMDDDDDDDGDDGDYDDNFYGSATPLPQFMPKTRGNRASRKPSAIRQASAPTIDAGALRKDGTSLSKVRSFLPPIPKVWRFSNEEQEDHSPSSINHLMARRPSSPVPSELPEPPPRVYNIGTINSSAVLRRVRE